MAPVAMPYNNPQHLNWSSLLPMSSWIYPDCGVGLIVNIAKLAI